MKREIDGIGATHAERWGLGERHCRSSRRAGFWETVHHVRTVVGREEAVGHGDEKSRLISKTTGRQGGLTMRAPDEKSAAGFLKGVEVKRIKRCD